MSPDLVALLAGTALAVGAVAFVLYPLFFDAAARSSRIGGDDAKGEDSAIFALREIEFDRATGKLSEDDYNELRKTYGERALKELRVSKERVPVEPLDPIEARVRVYRMTHRECPTCGLRPEPDAIYCSTCGGFLDRVCPRCAAEITEASAAFCSTCGATLDRRAALV
jgi:double zinc ribbon protein